MTAIELPDKRAPNRARDGIAEQDDLFAVSRLAAEPTCQQIGSSLLGLSVDEAARRLAVDGANLVTRERKLTIPEEIWNRAKNPLNALLLTLATISYFLGDIRAAVVIVIMVVLSIVTAFIQEHRSNEAAARLRAMVKTTASVRRGAADGQRRSFAEIPMEMLVPGDIVRLSAGDMIPADLRLLEAKDLFINQSTLTGEAMPVEKHAQAAIGAIDDPFDLPNICFMGTNVVSGYATGVIAAHRRRDVFRPARRRGRGQRDPDRFDKGIARFTWLMIRFMVVMVPLVFLINGLTKGDWLEALLFAVAVAVGLTPEMLPMIVTVNLAKGAVAMSRKKVIVKRLNAIQNFGAMDVLCTDKTGTLTQDRIILERHLDVSGEESDRVLRIRLPQQPLPVGPEEPARRRRARSTSRCTRRSTSTAASARSTKSRSISSAGACRWWCDQRRRQARPDLQGRGRGDLRRLQPTTSSARTRDSSMRAISPTAKQEMRGAQRRRLPRHRRRLQGDRPSPQAAYSRRRRVRSDPARLHRLPRSAEGQRARGDRGAGQARRAGQDPDRRQRGRHPQGLPRGRPRRRATSCSAARSRR